MSTRFLKDSAAGRIIAARAGVGPALDVATFGCSHMAIYWRRTHAYAVWLSKANIVMDTRQVYVEGANGQANDAQVTLATNSLADRGFMYATGGSTPDHQINTQLVQWNADVAAGRRVAIGAGDGSLYNNTAYTTLQVANKLQQVIDSFLYGPNQGLVFFVRGTHGLDPTVLAEWSSIWQRRADLSGGRIVYIDVAPRFIDHLAFDTSNRAAAAWTIRNAAPGQFGTNGPSVQGDGAHASAYGNLVEAELLAPHYERLVKPFAWGGGFVNKPYDPVNGSWGDLLGPDAGMVGTAGIDLTAGGGTFDANLPGSGHSGQLGGVQNKWSLSYGSLTKPGLSSTINSKTGQRQLEMTLSGNSDGSIIDLECRAAITNMNNSDAFRRYHAGIRLDYANVTGGQLPRLDLQGQPMSEAHNQSGADSLPNNYTGTLWMRTLIPVALSGDNLVLRARLFTRGMNGISGKITASEAFVRRAV